MWRCYYAAAVEIMLQTSWQLSEHCLWHRWFTSVLLYRPVYNWNWQAMCSSHSTFPRYRRSLHKRKLGSDVNCDSKYLTIRDEFGITFNRDNLFYANEQSGRLVCVLGVFSSLIWSHWCLQLYAVCVPFLVTNKHIPWKLTVHPKLFTWFTCAVLFIYWLTDICNR